MSWRNLKPSDRFFISEENDRIIQEMNDNAEYLATVQRIEAAKSRMEEARIAMELEDDPVKKARLAQLAGKYADQALAIHQKWESDVRLSNRRTARRTILLAWLFLIAFCIVFFPLILNLILIALFIIWVIWYYIVLWSEFHEEKPEPEKQDSETVVTEPYSGYEIQLNNKINTQMKNAKTWSAAMSMRVEKIILGEIEFHDLLEAYQQGAMILQSARDILAEVSHLPDNEVNREIVSDFTVIVSRMEEAMESLQNVIANSKITQISVNDD